MSNRALIAMVVLLGASSAASAQKYTLAVSGTVSRTPPHESTELEPAPPPLVIAPLVVLAPSPPPRARAVQRERPLWIIAVVAGALSVTALGISLGVGLSSPSGPSSTFGVVSR